MRKIVLVTTGNGMFGGTPVRELAGDPEISVRAMVRREPDHPVPGPNISYVIGDLDDPASLSAAVDGVTHVFLISPMDEHVATREINVIDAVVASGAKPHVLKLHGAVKHRGDHLVSLHEQSITRLKESGLPWTLVSPNSVMETSFNWLAETIQFDTIFGTSGRGRVGFVAAVDVGRVTAEVIRQGRFVNDDLLVTGPEVLDMYQVADLFSRALGREIHYRNLSEDDFATVMLNWGAFPDRDALEVGILCHFRAWGRSDADLVTDTCQQITGRDPMGVSEWIQIHLSRFNTPQTETDRQAAADLATQFD